MSSLTLFVTHIHKMCVGYRQICNANLCGLVLLNANHNYLCCEDETCNIDCVLFCS